MRLLTWPFYGILAVFEEVIRQAEDALYDEDALHAELKALYARFEAGEVSEEECDRREREVAARLALAEAYHRQRPRDAR